MAPINVALFRILRGYSSLAPPKSLSIPSHLSFAEIHDFLLSTLLLNSHLHQYPPSRQYQKSFWKWAIQILEDLLSEVGRISTRVKLALVARQDEEIDSRFYDHYLSVCHSCDSQVGPMIALHRTCTQEARNESLSFANVSPSQSYITYYWTPSNGNVNMESLLRLTLFESRMTIECGTTGLRTWKASFILADYLLNNPGKHFPFRQVV